MSVSANANTWSHAHGRPELDPNFAIDILHGSFIDNYQDDLLSSMPGAHHSNCPVPVPAYPSMPSMSPRTRTRPVIRPGPNVNSFRFHTMLLSCSHAR